jgi:hypothetical protein
MTPSRVCPFRCSFSNISVILFDESSKLQAESSRRCSGDGKQRSPETRCGILLCSEERVSLLQKMLSPKKRDIDLCSRHPWMQYSFCRREEESVTASPLGMITHDSFFSSSWETFTLGRQTLLRFYKKCFERKSLTKEETSETWKETCNEWMICWLHDPI